MPALDNKEKLAYALIAAFLLVKIAIALSFHPAGWDESVYYGMGKHLYSSGEAGLWEQIRPVGLPLLLGAVWKAGLPAFFSETLANLMAAGVLLLTYRIGERLFNRTAGLFGVMILGASSMFFVESSKFMTEIPSTLFAMLALYMMLTGKVYAGGLFAGIAAVFKFPHLLMMPVILMPLAAMLLKERKIRIAEARAALPFIAIIAAFLFANYIAYSDGIMDATAAFEPFILAAPHASNPLHAVEGFMPNLLFYVIALAKENLFFLFVPIGLAAAVKEWKADKRYAVLGYLALYLAYLTATINKQERFAILIMPVAAVFAGYGVYRLMLMKKGTSAAGIAITAALFLTAGYVAYDNATGDARYAMARLNAEPRTYNISGQVLSSEPYVAYYTNARVVPSYFSTADGERGIKEAVERLEENKDTALIYNEEDFYCSESDSYCREQLAKVKAIAAQRQKRTTGQSPS